MTNLEGRVVAITGASAGVGRAIAKEFAKSGARIGLIARGREGLLSAKREIESLGGKAVVCIADVAHETELEKAADAIEREFGPIDIWINNAMVSVLGPIKTLSSKEIQRVTDVTYMGSVHGILIALRRMSLRQRGHIIQIGSALAYRSIPLQSAYCAAKHAVHGFIESLRSELIHDLSPIHLSEVHLPAVNTPQFAWMRKHVAEDPQPVPPIYQPEVVARAVAYIARQPRRELWLGHSTMIAILGNRIFPWFADRYLAKRGYVGQFSETHRKRAAHDNLFFPADSREDFGARGDFTSQSRDRSIQFQLNSHRGLLGFISLATLGVFWGSFKYWRIGTNFNPT